MAGFDARTSFEGSAATVVCTGELDAAVTPDLWDVIEDCLRREVTSVHLDGAALTFMDSAGIAMLLRVIRTLGARGVELTWAFSEPVLRTLATAGLDEETLRSAGQRPTH